MAMLLCLVWPSLLLGQGTTVPAIPGAARNATNAAPYQNQIALFIRGQVKDLASPDPAVQKAAREALMQETIGPAGQMLSPSFLDVYANVLNTELLQMLKGSPVPVRARLNAAIVAARVAERADNSRLAGVTLELMRDKAEPVVLWGVKAAKWLVPPTLRNNSTEIIKGVLAAARTNPSGPVVQAAYEALAMRHLPSRAAAPMLPKVLQPILELLKLRVGKYADELPEDPLAETEVTSLLGSDAAWAVMDQKQRVETVGQLANLMVLAAQLTSEAPKPQRDALVDLIKNSASAMWVLAANLKNPRLQEVAHEITQVNSTLPSDQIQQRCQKLWPAIKAIPGYEQVKQVAGR